MRALIKTKCFSIILRSKITTEDDHSWSIVFYSIQSVHKYLLKHENRGAGEIT